MDIIKAIKIANETFQFTEEGNKGFKEFVLKTAKNAFQDTKEGNEKFREFVKYLITNNGLVSLKKEYVVCKMPIVYYL